MPILTRAKLAQRLELSETRIQQLTADGVLKRVSGGYDLAAAAVALLKHQRSDHESRAMRVRYQQSQASATELRIHRQLKRLIHFDEVGWLFNLFLEEAHKAAAGVAARVYADAALKLPELGARRVATFVHNELHGLIRAFQTTIDATLAFVRTEKLPSEGRLDLVARSLLPGNQAIVKAYLEKLTLEDSDDETKDHDQAEEAATGAEASDRRKRTRARVGSRARRASSTATATDDGD